MPCLRRNKSRLVEDGQLGWKFSPGWIRFLWKAWWSEFGFGENWAWNCRFNSETISKKWKNPIARIVGAITQDWLGIGSRDENAVGKHQPFGRLYGQMWDRVAYGVVRRVVEKISIFSVRTGNFFIHIYQRALRALWYIYIAPAGRVLFSSFSSSPSPPLSSLLSPLSSPLLSPRNM